MTDSHEAERARKRARELLAEAHRDFRAGLGARVSRLSSAIDLLGTGYASDAAESLCRHAHSLKGAAPSFGADSLAEPAATLEALSRVWLERGAVEGEELREARAALRDLEERAVRFVGTGEAGAGAG